MSVVVAGTSEEVVVEAGKRTWLGWINPGTSYLCSNDPRAHFGLGAVVKVDAIHVTWPATAATRPTLSGPAEPASRCSSC